METGVSREQQTHWGSDDAGQYLRYMSEFVGFTRSNAEAIKETHLIIEKYIPEIVGKFYAQLLSYPPTRKIFLKKDGTLDQDYLQLRLHHLTNFWRRTAAACMMITMPVLWIMSVALIPLMARIQRSTSRSGM